MKLDEFKVYAPIQFEENYANYLQAVDNIGELNNYETINAFRDIKIELIKANHTLFGNLLSIMNKENYNENESFEGYQFLTGLEHEFFNKSRHYENEQLRRKNIIL